MKHKRTARGWTVDDGEPRGWQNTSQFMARYPTRLERRAFYQRRTLYYRHVREGKACRTRESLQRYMSGAPQEAASAVPA